jgi:hypothetical protein
MRLWIKLGVFIVAFVMIAVLMDQHRIRRQLQELIRRPVTAPGVNERIEKLKARCWCMPPTIDALQPKPTTQPTSIPIS